MAEQTGFSLSGNILVHTDTSLHLILMIALRTSCYEEELPTAVPRVEKSKQRSLAPPDTPLSFCNVTQRTGPPPRKVIEIDKEIVMKAERTKNLIFLLARLHYAQHQQKVSSWTGFNIEVHDRECMSRAM